MLEIKSYTHFEGTRLRFLISKRFSSIGPSMSILK